MNPVYSELLQYCCDSFIQSLFREFMGSLTGLMCNLTLVIFFPENEIAMEFDSWGSRIILKVKICKVPS